MRKYFCFLALVTLITTNSASSQDIQRLGPNYFVAGIPSMTFYPVGQECKEWCWAASCQMVLNYHGLYVDQKEIVKRIFGTLICQGGTDLDIVNALSGWAPDYRGRYSEIHSQAGLIAPSDIVSSLAYHWPLIVALRNSNGSGHAEVMTAVYYSVDQYNNPIVDKVILRNPWYVYDGSQSKQEMSWYEFSNRVRDIFKIWVVRL